MEFPDASVAPAETIFFPPEKIVIKPSTELIPDEYEHEDNAKGLVLIFYSGSDAENMEMLIKVLTHHGYVIPDTNLCRISSKESVLKYLEIVSKEDHRDKTCLILAFMGQIGKESKFLPDEGGDPQNNIECREVWSFFTSDRCPSLRHKPKIFIFQACKEMDMVQYSVLPNRDVPTGAYGVPAEADILLIHKTVEVPWLRSKFIGEFANNLHYDGCKDDIIGLVTNLGVQNDRRLVVISTLTRKFYVRPSSSRNYFYDLSENCNLVFEMLQQVNQTITLLEQDITATS